MPYKLSHSKYSKSHSKYNITYWYFLFSWLKWFCVGYTFVFFFISSSSFSSSLNAHWVEYFLQRRHLDSFYNLAEMTSAPPDLNLMRIKYFLVRWHFGTSDVNGYREYNGLLREFGCNVTVRLRGAWNDIFLCIQFEF